MKRVFILAAVLLALGASEAQAAHVSSARPLSRYVPKQRIVYPPEVAGALEAAQTYWGISYPPLCETATIFFYVGIEAGRGADAGVPAPGRRNTCQMRLLLTLQDEYLCRAVVHEYGHWLGLEHTANPADVMYEGGPWWASIPECE